MRLGKGWVGRDVVERKTRELGEETWDIRANWEMENWDWGRDGQARGHWGRENKDTKERIVNWEMGNRDTRREREERKLVGRENWETRGVGQLGEDTGVGKKTGELGTGLGRGNWEWDWLG